MGRITGNITGGDGGEDYSASHALISGYESSCGWRAKTAGGLSQYRSAAGNGKCASWSALRTVGMRR